MSTSYENWQFITGHEPPVIVGKGPCSLKAMGTVGSLFGFSSDSTGSTVMHGHKLLPDLTIEVSGVDPRTNTRKVTIPWVEASDYEFPSDDSYGSIKRPLGSYTAVVRADLSGETIEHPDGWGVNPDGSINSIAYFPNPDGARFLQLWIGLRPTSDPHAAMPDMITRCKRADVTITSQRFKAELPVEEGSDIQVADDQGDLIDFTESDGGSQKSQDKARLDSSHPQGTDGDWTLFN